MVGKTQFLAY